MMKQLSYLCAAVCTISIPVISAENQECPWSFAWEARRNLREGGGHLRTDNLGNVYTVGTDFSKSPASLAVLKWDREGNLLWERLFRPDEGSHADTYGVSLELDKKRNVVVVARVQPGFILVSWTEHGDFRWYTPFSKDNFRTYPRDLAMDWRGNIYVTGVHRRATSNGKNRRRFLFVLKVGRKGKVLWFRRGASSIKKDFPFEINVDADGSSYVSGCTTDDRNNACIDALVAKYDTRGTLKWVSTYGSGRLDSLRVDNSGGLIIFKGLSGKRRRDQVLAKLNSTDGTQTWSTNVFGIFHKNRWPPYPMAIRGNDIYISGGTARGYLTTRRYSAIDGRKRWSRTWMKGSQLEANSVAIDGKGNIFVLGEESNYFPQCQILMYNNSGTLLYENKYQYDSDKTIIGEMALSCDGGVFVSAEAECPSGSGCGYAIVMVKYQACDTNQHVAREC